MKTVFNTPKLQIQLAVIDTLSLIAKGWEVDLAVQCKHDTIYDLISLNDFIVRVQAAIRKSDNSLTTQNS